MSATSTSRIWESPSEPSVLNHSSRSAQLPSIATLTNALPSANGAVSSPTYPLSNRDRDSDHWPSQPQSTRKFHPNRSCSGPQPHRRDESFPTPSTLLCQTYVYIRFLRLLVGSEWLLLLVVDQFSPSRLKFQSDDWNYFTSSRIPQRSGLRWSPTLARLCPTPDELGSSDTESVSRWAPVPQQP